MDDDVEALGPVGVVVDGVLVPGGRVGVVGDGPLDVSAPGDAPGEDVLLVRVVVAAPAEDQQRPNRPGRLLGHGRGPRPRQRPRKTEQQSDPSLHGGTSLFSEGPGRPAAGPPLRLAAG